MRYTQRWTGIAALALIATGCGDRQRDGLVARAGDHTLTVDDAVELLAAEPNIPADPETVGQLAELWMDYTLIAIAAREDTSLATVGLDAIRDLQVRQLLVNRFVEQAAPADTTVTDAELRELWDENPPRGEVRASHILMSTPLDATEAQVDSVVQLMEDLRRRAVAGESFGALARQYSQDASAGNGGDLGWFGPGDMVGPFDAAVYQLEVGEVSPVVRTGFGYHIIQLNDRRDPDFEQSKAQFRDQVVFRRLQQSDSAFMAGVMPEITLTDDAVAIVQELARLPRTPLNSRARSRALARFEGGALEAGELWDYMQTLSATEARLWGEAPAEQVEQLVLNLAQVEALAAIARAEGIEVTPAERDSIARVGLQSVTQVADMMGLRLITPEPGETEHQTVDRAIRSVVREILTGQRQAIPLSAATVALRQRLGGSIMQTGIQAAANRLQELRGTSGTTRPTPRPEPSAPDTTDADSDNGDSP